MPHYRDVLYQSYSSSFGDAKDYDPALAFRMYEQSYDLSSLRKSGRIADIGCGKCEWLSWLQTKGFTELQGFDISQSELAHARGISVECGDALSVLRRAEWRGRFSLIHAKDLIEHLTKQETIDFLAAAYEALQEGGRVWISTFNAQGIFSGATRYGDFTHESGFTPSSMAQVLRASGFEIEAVQGTHHCPKTWGGFGRKWIWRCAAFFGGLILRARHGGHREASVDTFSVAPDLFASARKSAKGDTR